MLTYQSIRAVHLFTASNLLRRGHPLSDIIGMIVALFGVFGREAFGRVVSGRKAFGIKAFRREAMSRTSINKRSERSILTLMTIVITLMIVMAFSITANAEEAKWEDLADDYTGKTVILQSNDVHGALDGYQYIAGLKAELERRNAKVILVDSGDILQGSIYVAEDKGGAAISLMKDCGYDFITIGNHDFDYGTQKLLDNLAGLNSDKTQILCSNLIKTDGSGECAFKENSVCSVTEDLKIGFYGVLSDSTKTSCMPGNITGMDFQEKQAMYDSLNSGIDSMEAQGADVIIGISHFGVDKLGDSDTSMDLYAGTKGSIGQANAGLTEAQIAGKYLILDGHSHTVMTEGVGGEPIMSTGTKFMNVGVVVIDNQTESIEDHFLFRLRVTDSPSASYRLGLPSDDAIRTKGEGIIADVDKKYAEVIAKSEVDLNGNKEKKTLPDGTVVRGNRDGETNFGDFITDGLLWYVMKKDTSAQLDPDNTVALTNGGAIRAAISKGDVTRKNVLEVMPFGNTICVVSISGSKLLEALEASTYATPMPLGSFPQVSNMEICLDESADYIPNDEPYPGSTYHGPKKINRIKSVRINGKELDPEKTYNVVTNNFVADGGDTYYAFTEAEVIDTGISDEAVIEQFMKDEIGLNGIIPVDPYEAPQGRIVIVDDAADVRQDLEDSIKGASKIRASEYKAESYRKFSEAVAAAKALLDGGTASTADLTEARSGVLSAWASLELKDAQTMKVTASKKTVRSSAVRKKTKTVKAIKVSDAKGAVSYRKLSGSKRLTVNMTSGKIKVKKGTRKGTYRIKVEVKASGDDNFTAGSKTVTVKVKVK